jgi:hypothetical protein
MTSEAVPWADRARAWVRRHPYVTTIAALTVAVRIAMPYVLRPVLESQISAQLNGRVEIEDVDLALLRGLAVVEGVRIFADDVTAPTISFARLSANVRWIALPFQEAIVEEIHLVSPRILVVRGGDGEINLARLPADRDQAPVEESPAESAEEEEAGWPAGLTRLILEDAAITFRDQTLPDGSEIDFAIERLEVLRSSYGGSIYEEDGKLTFVARVAGAPVEIEAGFDPEILNGTSSGNFTVKGLNVGLGAPYAAQLLGWSDLRGTLDIDLDFAAREADTHSPRIGFDLRDFSITVEGEEQPAIAWDLLTLQIEAIDPEDVVANVSSVRLTNLVLRVRPADEQPLVLLSKMDPAPAEPEESEAADEQPGTKPMWKVSEVAIEGAHILIEAPEQTLDVGIDVHATGLSSEKDTTGKLEIATAIEGGTLEIAGDISVAPPRFDGGLKVNELSLPPVVAVVPQPAAKIIRAGVARSDLQVSFAMRESDDEAAPVDATISGEIGLSGLEIAGPDPEIFTFKWDDANVSIEEIDIRDGVPAGDGGKAPIRIASIELEKPSFLGARLSDGTIALPPEIAGEAAPHNVEGGEEPAAAEPKVADEQEMPAVELAKFRLTDGSVKLVDYAVQPHTEPGASKIRIALDGVRMPERRIDNLELFVRGVHGGIFKSKGKLAGESTDIAFTIDRYRLRPYDPYATAFLGYEIRSGMLSVDSKISLQGDEFDTQSKITVHRLGLKNAGAQDAFEEEIGMPMSLALALLKDPQGDIKLDLPVSGNSNETNVSIASIVFEQLRRVFVNALLSPLKLFGAIGGGDDTIASIGTARIGFVEGSDTISSDGRGQAEKLAGLLRERPQLAIQLNAVNSQSDILPLQEKVLLAQLSESPPGDLATIREYLENRSAGREAQLPFHLQPILDEMLSHRRPGVKDLQENSRRRIETIRNLMVVELQVRPEQIVTDGPTGSRLTGGPPAVEAHLDVVDEEEGEPDLESDLG